jgi:SAM-dependent methyltransferase
MTKPIDSATDEPSLAPEVTPGPEVTVDESEMQDAGAPPDINGEESALPPVEGFQSPMRMPWAAQPTQPMHDEATVPLPVEDVEFAGPDEEFSAPLTPQPLSSHPAPAVGVADDDLEIVEPAPGGPAKRPPRTASSPPPPPPAAADAHRGPPELVRSGRTTPPPTPEPPRTRPAKPPPAPSPGSTAQPSAQATTSEVAPAPGPPQHPLIPPGATWAEALSQRPRKKRLKPWFEEVFDEDYLRTLPFMTPEQTLREVAFIRQALKPPTEGQVLDVACGYGRHAIELGQGGLRVTGIDLSLPLLIRAADESQRRALSVNFVHADMREMAFDSQFDGAYCFLSSFGYFDEETNLKVATSICRALRPGGRFLLDTVNRDYVVSELPTRVWWEGDGCVVLEEVDFNFHTSRLAIRRSVVFQDGRQIEHDISIRAYSLHELARLLRQAGFRVLDVSGSLATKGHFFGATSRNVIMVCERPAE